MTGLKNYQFTGLVEVFIGYCYIAHLYYNTYKISSIMSYLYTGPMLFSQNFCS